MHGLFAIVSLSVLKLALASANPSVSSCFSVNTAYDLGHSVASKTTEGPNACQDWCQVNEGIFT